MMNFVNFVQYWLLNTRTMKPGNFPFTRYFLICVSFLVLVSFACRRISSESDRESHQKEDHLSHQTSNPDSIGFYYDLHTPDKILYMPRILEELSGICLIDSSFIAAVQDERGTIFIIDLADGSIHRTIDFADKGDYEDIAYHPDRLFVLKSNGTIYEVSDHGTSDPRVIVHKTRLDSRNDCEGLAYSVKDEALLIACKGSPSIHKTNRYDGYRAVYRYSLMHKDVDDIPYLLLNLEALPVSEEKDGYEQFSDKLASMIDPHGSIVFQPSGIAVHPLSDHLYILSHVGKKLVITDHDGMILWSVDLNPRLLPQPEGICFGPDGTLYLASEGSGSDAIIAVYKPKLPY